MPEDMTMNPIYQAGWDEGARRQDEELKAAIASALADMDAELRDHPDDAETLHPTADRAAWEVLEIVAPEINRKREEMDARCKGFWYE